MKRKILITTSTFPKHSGDISSARFVLDLARALTEYYEVHVLAPHSPGSLREKNMEGIRVHRFRYFFPENLQKLTQDAGITPNLKKNRLLFLQLPFFFISETTAIARLVLREKIKVVNSHWIVPQGLAAAIVKSALKGKHVMTAHGTDVYTLKRLGKPGRMIAGYAVGRTDAVMPVSSYLKKTLDELTGREYRFEIAPMGIKSSLFGPGRRGRKRMKDSGRLRLLFVGKLIKIKGVHYLLEAVNILKENGICVELTIIGKGPLENELKSYVLEKELKSQVCFRGWVQNEKLPEFYSASDVTVVPSHDKSGDVEGMPVVILESMAMGTPVLASRISGIPDVVEDSVNGWLFESGSGEVLAEKLEEISGRDLEKFSDSAMKTAQKYTFRSIAEKYRDIIESFGR